jgi:putative ABC transport system permease protein
MYHIDNPTGNINIKDAKPFLNPRHPLIKMAVPLSLGDNYRSFRIVGTNHDILKLYGVQLGEGNLWAKDLEVTIGATVAKKSGLKIGDSFVSSHGFDEDPDLAHDHAKFVVTGILKGSGTVVDQLILTNTASIWEMHAHEGGAEDTHDHEHDHTAADSLDQHVHDNSNTDLLAHPEEQITSILVQYKSANNYQALNMPRAINENTAMQAASPAYEINKLYDMIGTGTETVRYIALLIAIVSLISIFISLYQSMKQRKYELALLRVMGSSRAGLFFLILLEGIGIAFLGWLTGTLLSHVGMMVLGHYLTEDFGYDFQAWVLLKEEWYLFFIALGLGIVAALVPALKAAGTDINQTLGEK